MGDQVVGYEYLRQQLALKTLPATRVARVRSYVTKVTSLDDTGGGPSP